MGFLKELGSFIGDVAGTVVGGTVKAVGEITGVEFLEEIGDGVKKASSIAGETLGKVASGAWDVGAGIITQDEQQLEEGFSDIGSAVSSTAKGIGNTIVNVAENGGKVIEGIFTGDGEEFMQGAKGLIKTAAISTLAIGVVDFIEGVDGTDVDIAADDVDELPHHLASTTTVDPNADTIDIPDTHHVEPHWRHLADGRTIWVDGDGDTSVNTSGGWDQHNPNYQVGHEPAVADSTPMHTSQNEGFVENPNMHHVEPHWRHLSDGRTIWVDGDGDSSVNTTGGWNQHNPDLKSKA
ncbi:hypothetical protein HQN89_27045 [Paenibacillus frigoriresistens]|uniref:hypothetical protein n=1 Tax=Paenibacillus alginolyticus TaxID=59839 RepID=UPI001566DDF8|nr:hypothetical protein [Paenibacillus frigoriresistens]NRF94564.1 hypothetical protein [Paenibacillus frigoriresistens]